MHLVSIGRDLSERVDALRFPSVPFVYNPLEYARTPYEAYLERWGSRVPREVLMVGMNPGPFGMAQTGVPFGDVTMVRDFLGITGAGRKAAARAPAPTDHRFRVHALGGERHAPVGLGAGSRSGTADRFFERVFVANWCPLVFMDESGRNRPPDKLPAAERGPLARVCNDALSRVAEALRPTLVVGIGRFAEQRAREALGSEARIGGILHPSPASPAANRDWPGLVDEQLRALGFARPSRNP